MQRIDVIVNVYGKPWQTLCAIKSLIKHSGQLVDKIYLTIEKHHPYDDDPSWIVQGIDCIYYTPKEFYGVSSFSVDWTDKSIDRYNFRYQYGIDNSDKEHVFIMHNDILFTGDIIGNMLDRIGDNAGIGLIGQCWNCSPFKAGLCDGGRYDKVEFTYEEIIDIRNKFPMARHQFINEHKPMPLPECRLNEFACIIRKDLGMRTPLFASMEVLDTGCAWFRARVDEGYKFVNYDINKDSDHGYFSKIEARNYDSDKSFFVSGYPTQLQEKLYWKAEEEAMKYYQDNLWHE